MTTRRMVLQTGGAAIVVGTLTGAGAFAVTRTPRRALEPWSRAGESFGDPRLDALSFAILAPNPHNMQPWRVALDGDDALTVYCDTARLLPETDPPSRQITIGFGCFLELFRQAAAEKGHLAEITAFPEGEPQPALDERPVARVVIRADASAARDPLFWSSRLRRTNRTPFEARAVDAQLLNEIAAAGGDRVVARAITSAQGVEELRKLTRDAWRIEWTLPRTRAESINVTRIGKAEIEAQPWGLSLGGPALEALSIAGVVTREKSGQPGEMAFEESLAFYDKACASAAAFIATSTATNTRADQLAAGAAWVRIHQAAAQRGVAFHPLSQALQEFPEMAPAYDRAHEILAHQPRATVQMLARLGYAKDQPPSPRERLEAKLIAA
ncbi:MAG: hypothetical protein U5J99_11665 [Parvularculaceae bacterium]|nr:hypothetical protein [Parvularculaceae bacterium]